MQIVMISTHDCAGGAAIASFRLHHSFRSIGQNSAMLVKQVSSKDPDVYRVLVNHPDSQIEQDLFFILNKLAIQENRSALSNTYFSLSYPGYDLSRIPLVREADIINIHWVATFQSVKSIANLLKLGKPVVWTLHDEYAYTGGCHYTAGCRNYLEDCRDCPQLKNNQHQLPLHILREKSVQWHGADLTIVTPSHWLADCARQSSLFRDRRIEVIPYSLDTDVFIPHDNMTARNWFKIPPDSICLLFGAYTNTEQRKGFIKMLEAVQYCMADPQFKQLASQGKLHIMTFGPPQQALLDTGIPIISSGYIGDNHTLARVYSAADIFVLPSLEDNLPNTMLESMSCGVPVVGFHVGGLPDMITHGQTGFTVPCFDSKALGDAILQLVRDPQLRKQMGKNCRLLIEEKYKLQYQANNYISLFSDLLARKTSNTEIPPLRDGETTTKHNEITISEWSPYIPVQLFELYRAATLRLIKYLYQEFRKPSPSFSIWTKDFTGKVKRTFSKWYRRWKYR